MINNIATNCHITHGANFSILVDTQKFQIYRFPNKFIDTENGVDLSEGLAAKLKERKIITPFENLDYTFEMPDFDEYIGVDDAIICVDYEFDLLQNILIELDELKCSHLELRIHNKLTVNQITNLGEWLNGLNIITVDILIGKGQDNIRLIKNICSNIIRIVIYESDEDCVDNNVIFVKSPLSNLLCGKISPDLFMINPLFYSISQFHNSCLSRKISVDFDGSIKNCPSMPRSFGNIRHTTLKEALEKPEFKKHWNITKDKVSVCSDCEFRYVCTDCRAYIEQPEDIHSKPLKCGYNPYTGEWEEWSTNPLKQKAIDYYCMYEILPAFQIKPDYVPPT